MDGLEEIGIQNASSRSENEDSGSPLVTPCQHSGTMEKESNDANDKRYSQHVEDRQHST